MLWDSDFYQDKLKFLLQGYLKNRFVFLIVLNGLYYSWIL